jgi:hypothetical protein
MANLLMFKSELKKGTVSIREEVEGLSRKWDRDADAL